MKTAVILVAMAPLALACLCVFAAAAGAGHAPEDEPRKAFAAFTMKELAQSRARSGREYLSFFANDTMHAGVYALDAGAQDRQSPHDEDELYHVVRGRASFTAGDETVEVAPGSILFVAAGVPHRFHDIEEDLEILVFFSRAEPGGEAQP